MQCSNHPSARAYDRCVGCAEPFCPDCLVEIHGEPYCGSCKVMAVQGRPRDEAATRPCKEANDALTYAIVGIFCFGIILEPIAIVKAFKAKNLIDRDPTLTGSGKATAALIIGFVSLGLWVIGLIVRFSALAQVGPR
jgi:hypothetical protein